MSSNKIINNKNIVFKQSSWDLTDLVSDYNSDKFHKRIENLKNKLNTFYNNNKDLNNSINSKKVVEILTQLNEIKCELGKILTFAELWFEENTQNEKALSFLNNMDKFNLDLKNKTLFFEKWFENLTENIAKEIILNINNNDFKYELKKLRNKKKYSMNLKEEEIINIKNNSGKNTLVNIYNILVSDFEYKLTLNKKNKVLNSTEISKYIKSSDYNIRTKSYKSFLKEYNNYEILLNEIFLGISKDWQFESKIRGYKESIFMRNIENEISDKIIFTLLDTCKKNSYIFHKYFKSKSKCLGLKKMSKFDMYASIGEIKLNFEYNDAINLILDSFKDFSDNFYNNAKKIIESNHIDSETRKGKSINNFCCNSAPNTTPYILVDYNKDLSSIFRLSHEIGHGIHYIFSSNHSFETFHPTLILSETASIFSEILLLDKILSNVEEDKEKIKILSYKIDEIFTSVITESYITIFENEIHSKIEENLSLGDIKKMWMANLKEQFGNSIIISKDFGIEYLTIPHIFNSQFYCYSYSFGHLVALSLFQLYKEEGDIFIPKIEKILSYGGSKEPLDILKEIGIDISSSEFWKKGFNYIDNLINEYIDLVKYKK